MMYAVVPPVPLCGSAPREQFLERIQFHCLLGYVDITNGFYLMNTDNT